MPADDSSPVPDAHPPRIYLHIGEPKTGTTYLQHAIWGNRGRLADRGFLIPGYTRRDTTRASRDLRGTPRSPQDPADPWVGEWDVLAGQALRCPDAAVISDELLSACTPAQADRAVRSLLSAEPHIIVAVRDFATLLPAEWQESVKTRHTAPWEQWLDAIVDSATAADRRAKSWFWTVHDTLATLSMWSQHLPPDRVHVITMPRDSSSDALWERFASVLGMDSDGIDLSQARANSSLGLPETEFLRRLNVALEEELPTWYYTRYLKQILAHDVLTEQPSGLRVTLPPGREAWAREQSELLVAALRDAKYHIVGDLDELLPAPAGSTAAYVAPEQQPAEQMLDVAVHTAAVLANVRYREMYQVRPKPGRRPRPSVRRVVSRLGWSTLNGPRAKRILRNHSQRPSVRRLRIAIWWMLMRPTSHRRGLAGFEDATGRRSAAFLAGGRPGLGGREPMAQAAGGAPVEPNLGRHGRRQRRRLIPACTSRSHLAAACTTIYRENFSYGLAACRKSGAP